MTNNQMEEKQNVWWVVAIKQSAKVTLITCMVIAFVIVCFNVRFRPYQYPWKIEICSQPTYLGIADDSFSCQDNHKKFLQKVAFAYFMTIVYLMGYIGGFIFIPTFIYKKINLKERAKNDINS
jgi:hypothetical protein